MKITTPKLSDLAPTWAPFAGWTVLFDNPGSVRRRSQVRLLDASLLSPRRRLYRQLAEVADVVAGEFVEVPWAWLPPSSYHVTLMDGLSSPHCARLSGDNSALLEPALADVPTSLVGSGEVFFGVDEAVNALINSVDTDIEMCFGAVRCRGHAVLAELRPTAASLTAFDRIVAARAEALRELAAATGLDLVTTFQPHVTLGYVANRDAAKEVSSSVESFVAARCHAGRTIRFGSASVYGFSSMAHYWHLPPFDS